MATGRDMDFAIKGPGLIAVQGPEGEAYTRHGSLRCKSRGQAKTGKSVSCSRLPIGR